MCGITVWVKDPRIRVNNGGVDGQVGGAAEPITQKQLQASIEMLNHRGPDESGIWESPDGNVGLGHCRLSINDLGPGGRQPLVSDDGEMHAVVNGEIYDHDRLRRVCSEEHGYRFSGQSDSELVLALYKIHGAPAFLEHLRGEFSFVLHDGREGSMRVIAARDRYGVKPLLWTAVGGKILIAAEAKAFLPLGWKPEWDVEAIVSSAWYLDQRTLFKGVDKVMPGHWLDITDAGVDDHCYWDVEYEDKRKVDTRTVDEMVLGLRERLVESVRLRLRADVPVGIYLSGGIDSSVVAGIVTQLARGDKVRIGSQESPRVACFSVEFAGGAAYDESSIAERTAEWLGVDVFKKRVTEETLARDFAAAVYHSEHHNFDLNSVAKFSLSTLAREHGFKVILTGEGSDEHFAGYPYYPPELLREPDYSQPNAPLTRQNELREKLSVVADEEARTVFHRFGSVIYKRDFDSSRPSSGSMPGTLALWRTNLQLFAPWATEKGSAICPKDVALASFSSHVRASMASRWHPLHSALYMVNKTLLVNVNLACLGDRTEMAHSIEGRTPFLDHHLTGYINRLPPSVKLAFAPPDQDVDDGRDSIWQNGVPVLSSFTDKWILREAARPFVTDELYRRKKHPFLAPSRWPRDGPLHRMFSALLTREAVEGLGFVSYEAVQENLARAFGDDGDGNAFRSLVFVGAWVTLADRFGIEKADVQDWAG